MGAPVVFVAHRGAGRGAFARVWPPVAAALQVAGIDHEVLPTTRAGAAGELARQAADDGARAVLAVGGDGTLSEVVDGLLAGRQELPGTLAVGVVPAGRGSDYARGVARDRDVPAILARLGRWLAGDVSAARLVDAGEVAFVSGGPRRFINAAGVGFSPAVSRRTARLPAALGAAMYTVAGLVSILDWRERRVRLHWDDGSLTEEAVESVELALGPYEGGGMLVAPAADPSDGLFEAVVIGAVGRLEMLTFSWRVRDGAHLTSPRVRVRRTSRLGIEVIDGRGPLWGQADGELLGRDPFEFRVLPSALRFLC
ncbi:MAG TPA: YegS/Rv2252/BmrU family lipid kinase [Candidatus Limnocylindrales bacterium]|nr:YegS/Rv2252/BmrU family lipid kinase [Candidatus Limnocylindrales bacterium]